MTVFRHLDPSVTTIQNGLFICDPGFAVIAHYATTNVADRGDEKSG